MVYRRPFGAAPAPVCLLCGVRIEIADELGMPKTNKEHQRVSKELWKQIWTPSRQHFMVSAPEVENAHIDKFPLLWLGLYRASKPLKRDTGYKIFAVLIHSVIKDSNTMYHLTGINLIHGDCGPFHAVNDPGKARMSGKKNARYHPREFTKFYAAYIRSRRQAKNYIGKTVGYFVHAHCWSLFGRVEGLGLNNVNLVKLVKVCRKYWGQKDSSWGICSDFVGPSIILSLSHGLGESQNPLIVPAIEQAIHSAETAFDDLSPDLSIFPLELMVLISEYVCPMADYTVDDVQNLRNMLLAFRWQLPKYFWRVRLDERLFFELAKFDENSSADWKLRLNLMSLVADPKKLEDSGLVNRERVLGIMRALKEAYAN